MGVKFLVCLLGSNNPKDYLEDTVDKTNSERLVVFRSGGIAQLGER